MIRTIAESRVGIGRTSRFVNRNPILICGAPRTGTSWTAKVLSLGGNVRYLREPLSHGGYAASSGVLGYPYLGAVDNDAQYEAAWRRVLSLDPLIGRRWLMSHTRSWLQRTPFWPARLLVKEVSCPLALDWLTDRFPISVVITVRHPCGYVASGLRLAKVGHPVIELNGLLSQPALMNEFSAKDQDWLVSLEDPMARMAAAFGMVYKILGEQLESHPEWTVVHHESLCRDPRGGFRRLCQPVSLSYNRRLERFLDDSTVTPDDSLYSLHRISSEQPDKWKEELTPKQVDIVAGVISRFRLPFYRDFA